MAEQSNQIAKEEENPTDFVATLTDLMQKTNPDMAKGVTMSDCIQFYELTKEEDLEQFKASVAELTNNTKKTNSAMVKEITMSDYFKYYELTKPEAAPAQEVMGMAEDLNALLAVDGKMPLRVWQDNPLFNQDVCLNYGGCCICHKACDCRCACPCMTTTCKGAMCCGFLKLAWTCTCVPTLFKPCCGTCPCCVITEVVDLPGSDAKTIVKKDDAAAMKKTIENAAAPLTAASE